MCRFATGSAGWPSRSFANSHNPAAIAEADVVVGRKPEPIDGSATLEVPDRTRTLSKSHARLTRVGASWIIEDLGSTNGLVLMNEDGTESELSPGVRVEATERMLFGTLEVRLRPGGDAA